MTNTCACYIQYPPATGVNVDAVDITMNHESIQDIYKQILGHNLIQVVTNTCACYIQYSPATGVNVDAVDITMSHESIGHKLI